MASPPSQKPILLQGHERSITQIKYNREGDLLFTVAKDPVSGPALSTPFPGWTPALAAIVTRLFISAIN